MVRAERGESIRKKVYEAWVQNPYFTATKICRKLHLKYKKHGNYVNKLLSEFRSYHKLGLPLGPQKLPHKRVFVWENVPRSLFCGVRVVGREFESEGHLRAAMRLCGWSEVANRNQMWVFRDDLGAVHWYKGGLVRLYLRGALQLAKAKELFCRAFSWLGDEELAKYLDVPLREKSKHWVFELGAPVPRFDIRKFERSHGIRIFADGSHPTAVEVEETEPFWIGELREVTRAFGEEIKAHMELIKEWQKEAKARREQGLWNRIKRLLLRAHE